MDLAGVMCITLQPDPIDADNSPLQETSSDRIAIHPPFSRAVEDAMFAFARPDYGFL